MSISFTIHNGGNGSIAHKRMPGIKFVNPVSLASKASEGSGADYAAEVIVAGHICLDVIPDLGKNGLNNEILLIMVPRVTQF